MSPGHAQHLLIAGALTGASLWAGLLGGCASEAKPDLDSPVAAARIEAMGEAAQRKDPKEIRDLITLLDSDDAAVRVFAIASLEKITGERRGYDPTAQPRFRRDAADRWQEWYGQEYGAGSPSIGTTRTGTQSENATQGQTGGGAVGRGGPAGHSP